jgi:hypothetical protein
MSFAFQTVLSKMKGNVARLVLIHSLSRSTNADHFTKYDILCFSFSNGLVYYVKGTDSLKFTSLELEHFKKCEISWFFTRIRDTQIFKMFLICTTIRCSFDE